MDVSVFTFKTGMNKNEKRIFQSNFLSFVLQRFKPSLLLSLSCTLSPSLTVFHLYGSCAPPLTDIFESEAIEDLVDWLVLICDELISVTYNPPYLMVYVE